MPPAFGGSITDVSANNSVSVSAGDSLIVDVGTWTYSSNNRGYDPYPNTIHFEAFGPQIAAPLTSLPWSSAQYYAGYSMTGYLESADGSHAVALTDANATRAGYAVGTLLFTPGTYSGSNGTQQVSVVSGDVTLSAAAAQSLFGPNAAQAWVSDARIVVTNNGLPVSLGGLGNGYSLKNAFLEPGLQGSGPTQTSGITLSVQLDTTGGAQGPTAAAPEPSGLFLLAGGLIMLSGMAAFRVRGQGNSSAE